MDKVLLDMINEGKDVNEILNMPYHYVIQLLEERQKPKQEKSLIAAFGGTSPKA